MKTLKLPETSFLVQRTGLPFYDAARLIGVAQLFFGTASATVKETCIGWRLQGIANLEDLEAAEQRLWNTERLQGFERKPNNYGRIQKWQDKTNGEETKLQQKWERLKQHFAPPSSLTSITKTVNENTTGLMDSALAMGTRGVDPTGYGDLAAENGLPSQQPEEETLVALIGLSYAARINNTMFLLPIFGDAPNDKPGTRHPITTANYFTLKQRFQHEGGESIAATWAMLSHLEELFDINLPIRDFAYNRAERPIYHSGTLGADQLCRWWHEGGREVLNEIREFLQSTQREKGGHRADLARALAELARNRDVPSFERAVRLKARAMAEDDFHARKITLKEIHTMLKLEIPDLPEGLCLTVRRALDTADKGWIGRYMKLENANDATRFFQEIERLLSRTAMKSSENKMSYSIYYATGATETDLPTLIGKLEGNTRTFRAFRAAFLLKVLQVPDRSNRTEEVAESIPSAEEEKN